MSVGAELAKLTGPCGHLRSRAEAETWESIGPRVVQTKPGTEGVTTPVN